MSTTREEIEATLKRARKTVAAAKALMAEADLRIQETDRFLAKQGLTREQVMAMQFTAEQRALVNEELKRKGLPPLDDEVAPASDFDSGRRLPEATEAPTTVGERQRRFGTFMQQFRI